MTTAAPELKQSTTATPQPTSESVFASQEAEVHDIPMSVILRPVMPVLDACKVEDFKTRIEAGDEFTPIEVAWVQDEQGHNYYYAFGGCHRYEAHMQLKRPTIRARLIKVSTATISLYLGASSPFRKKVAAESHTDAIAAAEDGSG